MPYSCRVVLDSISEAGARITTFELTYPRFVHAEFMTHRAFSRNASSSRALGRRTVLRRVLNDPVEPIDWGIDQKGMVAERSATGWRLALGRRIWYATRYGAVAGAYLMEKLGFHKQLVNRMTEPWQWITVVCTATSYDNFFFLRCHKDAQPEIALIAMMMRACYETGRPAERQWHLPYVTEQELGQFDIEDLIEISVARCARVSSLTHGRVDIEADKRLYNRLAGALPPHESPFEHVATANADPNSAFANLRGWVSWRWLNERGLVSSLKLDRRIAA